MPTSGRPQFRSGRFARVLAGAGTAVLLGYGVLLGQRIAGEHRWQTYRAEAAARGFTLSLPAADAPLPKETNLAAEAPFAPIQVRLDGKPVGAPTLRNDLLPADYLADLSRGKLADLSASAPQLQRCNTSAMMVSDREFAAALLSACDRQMGPNWSRVLAAEARSETRFNIRYWPMPMTEKVPAADFRIAVQTHALRATALLYLGRSKEAVEELRGGMRLAGALQADPSLAIFMLRTALVGMTLNVVWDGLNTGAWSDADLVTLDGMISSVQLGLGYATAVETERGWINAMCDELATDSSNPSPVVLKKWEAALEPSVVFPGMHHWKRATVRGNQLMFNQHYDAVRERIDAAGNWHAVALPLDAISAKSWRLAGLAMVDFSKVEGRVLAAESRVRQARLAIAVERYRRKTGSLPALLGAVVPDYLPQVLADPIDGAPMRYSRDAARAFRLWSIGDDREDDKGVADPASCQMTLDVVWPGLVPGRNPKPERPPERGPRALRSTTSSYAMAW